jgi:hypothetical protein
MANISARTNQSEMILKICLQYFLISKMRTSSDIVYYFRDHALVFYVCMNFFDQTKFEIFAQRVKVEIVLEQRHVAFLSPSKI